MSSLRLGLTRLIREATDLAEDLEEEASEWAPGSPIHGKALKLYDMLTLIRDSSAGAIVDIEPN